MLPVATHLYRGLFSLAVRLCVFVFDNIAAAFRALRNMWFQLSPPHLCASCFFCCYFFYLVFCVCLCLIWPPFYFHPNVLDARDSGARSRTSMRRCPSIISEIIFLLPNGLHGEIALLTLYILASRFLQCCPPPNRLHILSPFLHFRTIHL